MTLKINKPHIPAINPYQANDMKLKKSTKQQAIQQDKLEISTKAKELSELTSTTTARSERVQSMKEQINSGNYEVNPGKVAQSLVKYFQSGE